MGFDEGISLVMVEGNSNKQTNKKQEKKENNKKKQQQQNQGALALHESKYSIFSRNTLAT